jgi:hypothetical protein
MSLGLMFLAVGVLWLILWRWGHDRGLLLFGTKTVWPSAPGWIRRLARSDAGEVNALALANELWGLAVVGYGVVLLLTPPEDPALGVVFARVVITLLIPIVLAGAYVFSRGRKRRS